MSFSEMMSLFIMDLTKSGVGVHRKKKKLKKIFLNTVADISSFNIINDTTWFTLVGPYMVTAPYMVIQLNARLKS